MESARIAVCLCISNLHFAGGNAGRSTNMLLYERNEVRQELRYEEERCRSSTFCLLVYFSFTGVVHEFIYILDVLFFMLHLLAVTEGSCS